MFFFSKSFHISYLNYFLKIIKCVCNINISITEKYPWSKSLNCKKINYFNIVSSLYYNNYNYIFLCII